MDRLRCMQVFVRVAQYSGFSAAARDLRMSPAAVTKHVAALEGELGARLFDRTTRSVGLTEAGRLYLERCIEALQALEDADNSVIELGRQPKGILRVTSPLEFAESLAPVFRVLAEQHPALAVDLRVSNRVVDLVEEGLDVAIRVAPALDGQFVARPVARTRLLLCAAESYLIKYGTPGTPEDLVRHRHLLFNEPKVRDEWVFSKSKRSVRVRFEPVMTSNSGSALQEAACTGLGLLIGPSLLLPRDLLAGRLKLLLTDWSLPDLRVFAVYPHRRFVSPKVRAFLEAMRAAFGDGSLDPWWPLARAHAAPAPALAPVAMRPRARTKKSAPARR